MILFHLCWWLPFFLLSSHSPSITMSIYIVIYLIGDDWQYLGYISFVLLLIFCVLQALSNDFYKLQFIFNESILMLVVKASRKPLWNLKHKSDECFHLAKFMIRCSTAAFGRFPSIVSLFYFPFEADFFLCC